MAKRILVGKIDLDTAGAAFLLGVTREDEVEVVRSGQASEADLANPDVLCIEVGGSGQVNLRNFDHHGLGSEGLPSATTQAFLHVYEEEILEAAAQYGMPSCIVGVHCLSASCNWECFGNLAEATAKVFRLVEYINILDIQGPQALLRGGSREDRVGKITLSDVFAGMLLVTRDPVEQLHKGVEILRGVINVRCDPFGHIPTWPDYAKAKAENNRQIAGDDHRLSSRGF